MATPQSDPLRDIDDAIWIVEPDSTLSYINTSGLDFHAGLYGLKASIGSPVSDLYPPADRSRWIDRYKRAAAGENVLTLESLTAGGNEQYWELGFEPARGHRGTRVVVIARQISDRRKTTLATTFEARGVMDTDTRILFAGQKLKDLLGPSESWAAGTMRLSSFVDPEDLPALLETMSTVGETPVRIERLRLTDLCGNLRETVGVIARSPDSGNLAFSLLDITSQIDTRQRLASTAEHLRALHSLAAELNNHIEHPETLYEVALELLSSAVRFDTASVQILVDDRLCVVASSGFEDPEFVKTVRFPFDKKFPNWNVVTSRELIAVADVREQFEHFETQASDFASGSIAAWLGVPLSVRDEVIGMVALDRHDPTPFTEDEQRLAQTMAGHIAVAVHNAQLYRDLRRGEEALAQANTQKETLLRELHHRSKNNMQLISSLLSLGAASVSVEEDGAVLDEVRLRIQSLATIHEELYRSDNLDRVDLADYTDRLTRMIAASYGRDGITLSVETDDLDASIDSSVPFGLILSELVLNAYKHAFPGKRTGSIKVNLTQDAGQALLVVEDNGVGLKPAALADSGDGLGMQLVSSLVEQIEGSLDLADGPGTRWLIRFAPRGGA